ncbi:MAG: hypothetical protein NTY07_05635 [Bacteroidia bacterium]|nr:hypothetical protein [Bacteroidia bacterium]
MKTTKFMIIITVAFIFVFFSGNVFAQTRAESHTNLTNHHQAIMKHANAIASGEAKTLNDQIMNANEARKSLAEAKKAHSQLKKALPEKSKSDAIIHHDNIDRYHATATTHANSLLNELRNSNPDDAKLKEYAKKLHDAAEMAEKEHQSLIKVTR